MPELKPWSELPPGGSSSATRPSSPETGGWRTGLKPQADLSTLRELPALLALLPRLGGRLDGTTFAGFDLRYCKGCEICAEICPVDAIEMVAEERRP